MEIAFLIRKLDCGGAEKQLIITAKGLSERGHNVTIYTFYTNGELEYELNETSVKLSCLGKKGRWDILSLLINLFKFIKRDKVEVLYSFMYTQNIIAAIIKIVYHKLAVIWGVRCSFMDFEKYTKLFKVAFKFECFMSRIPNLIISNSEAGKEYALKSGYKNKNFKVMFNGIDCESFKPDDQLGMELRKELDIGENQKLIGIISRIDYIKGHETFIRAASKISKLREDVVFICVGGGNEEYKNYLINLTEELQIKNKIIWYGKSKEVNKIYNALDILTSTSYGEGFSNVIAEAMACGVPCVVTDVGDSAYIVSEYGKVINVNDEEELMNKWNAILSLSEEKIIKLKYNCRKRIENKFSVENLIKNTEEEMRQIFR